MFQTSKDYCARRHDGERPVSRRGDCGEHRGQPIDLQRDDGGFGLIGRQSGHDEQLRLGQRTHSELRNDLRRNGRWTRVRRLLGCANAYDQHARHRPRSAGVSVSRPLRRMVDQTRLGWRWRVQWRRRHHPQDAVFGTDDGYDTLLSSPGQTFRGRRRIPRRSWPRVD